MSSLLPSHTVVMRSTVLLIFLLSMEVMCFTLPRARTARLAATKTVSFKISPLWSIGTGSPAEKENNDEEKEKMIKKRDEFIRKLESQLDVLESQLISKEAELEETKSALSKRDALIDSLDLEVLELEDMLKSAGKFQEKKPPLKGRKVVPGDEDEWDPMQDVPGSLPFHLAMTIRLTIITVFWKIPRFVISLPTRLIGMIR